MLRFCYILTPVYYGTVSRSYDNCFLRNDSVTFVTYMQIYVYVQHRIYNLFIHLLNTRVYHIWAFGKLEKPRSVSNITAVKTGFSKMNLRWNDIVQQAFFKNNGSQRYIVSLYHIHCIRSFSVTANTTEKHSTQIITSSVYLVV